MKLDLVKDKIVNVSNCFLEFLMQVIEPCRRAKFIDANFYAGYCLLLLSELANGTGEYGRRGILLI